MQEHEQDERRWQLAARVLTGTLPADEQEEWNEFLADTSFADEFARVTAYWQKLGTLPYQEIDTQKDWQAVLAKVHEGRATRTLPLLPWLRYAAAIAAFVVVAGLGWWLGRQERAGTIAGVVMTTVEAPAGSKTYVTLPDSSSVWLNAGSRITFASNFGAANRNIDLAGEAFFDVKKKPVPFTVHTDAYTIAVLGTAFNVQAYADDDRVTTTLVRGSLKVTRPHLTATADDVLLVPNDRLVFSKTGGNNGVATLEHNINAAQATAWKDGWLAVSGESLEELARKMERLYDISIHFQDAGLQQYRFTGRIRQLSLEQVLKALSLTAPVEFSIREKEVTLRENKATRSTYRSLQTHP